MVRAELKKDFPTPDKDIVVFIGDLARLYPEIDRIDLFGSRIRGDHDERSDYDLAVFAPKIDSTH